MERKILSTAEAAQLMGMSPQWLRMLARANEIPSHKPYPGAKKYFFYADELPIVSGAEL